MVWQEDKGRRGASSVGTPSQRSQHLSVELPGDTKAEEAVCAPWMYLQVTVDESIDLWHALMIDCSQNNYEEDHH